MTSSVMAAGRTASRQARALGAVEGRHDLQAFLGQQPRQQVVDDGIVVDHEHGSCADVPLAPAGRSPAVTSAAGVAVGRHS